MALSLPSTSSAPSKATSIRGNSFKLPSGNLFSRIRQDAWNDDGMQALRVMEPEEWSLANLSTAKTTVDPDPIPMIVLVEM